jgi:hypothetical protein
MASVLYNAATIHLSEEEMHGMLDLRYKRGERGSRRWFAFLRSARIRDNTTRESFIQISLPFYCAITFTFTVLEGSVDPQVK